VNLPKKKKKYFNSEDNGKSPQKQNYFTTSYDLSDSGLSAHDISLITQPDSGNLRTRKKKLTRNMKIKEKRRKSAENKLERAKKFALAKSLGIQFEEPTLESIAEKKRNADNGQN